MRRLSSPHRARLWLVRSARADQRAAAGLFHALHERALPEVGVVDPDEHEIAAIAAASPMAGEYLESIGKTDLAVLTEAEWLTLLEVIITAYQDELARLLDHGRHPAPPLAAGGRP